MTAHGGPAAAFSFIIKFLRKDGKRGILRLQVQGVSGRIKGRCGIPGRH